MLSFIVFFFLIAIELFFKFSGKEPLMNNIHYDNADPQKGFETSDAGQRRNQRVGVAPINLNILQEPKVIEEIVRVCHLIDIFYFI